MDVGKRRVGVRGSVVAAGSVWETRMKSDEVRGGVRVFNGDENSEQGGGNNNNNNSNNNVGGTRLKRGQVGVSVPTGKRKTWKSESTEGSEKSPIQIARGKTEQKQSNCGEEQEQGKDVSNGIKRTPIQARKKVVKSEGSPIHKTRKLRSEVEEEEEEQNNGDSEKCEPGDGAERGVGKLRKSKSDSVKAENQSAKGVQGSIQLRKTKSESDHDPRNGIDDENVLIENENEKNGGSDEDCKDFGVCQEKIISSTSTELSVVHADGDSDGVVEEDEVKEEEEEDEEEEEEEEEAIDVKEIGIAESKVVKEPEKKVVVNEPQKKVIAVKEQEKKKIVNEPEPKKVMTRRFQQRNERPVSVPHTVNQSPPIIRRHSTIYQNFSKSNNNSIPKTEECSSFPHTQSKLQSLVDLIMWRDISRSAFIFGFGTFVIVSSSYAKDINLSLISVTSYMGLVYLAVIFLYRSLICRGVIDVDNTNYVLGEEEAIWVLKLILPYLNEFLSRLKAMFSGDPGTTIKLAVLLFVLARCGSSITIWKMAKFGFFGVFTVPKICSSYSSQLTAYGNFWMRRFRDAWDSCSHKKAVALGIFGLVWNLSSVVARIWAVFVLFVAFRYYQQHYLVRDEWVEDEGGCDETWQEQHDVGVGVHHRQGGRAAPNFVETNKVKKGF